MVVAGLPERVVALHPVPADEHVLGGRVERMAHVQVAGDVGRRERDRERLVVPRTRAGPIEALFLPGSLPGLFDAFGPVERVHGPDCIGRAALRLPQREAPPGYRAPAETISQVGAHAFHSSAIEQCTVDIWKRGGWCQRSTDGTDTPPREGGRSMKLTGALIVVLALAAVSAAIEAQGVDRTGDRDGGLLLPARAHGRRPGRPRRLEKPRPGAAQRQLDRAGARTEHGCSARERSGSGERSRHERRDARARTGTSAPWTTRTCAARWSCGSRGGTRRQAEPSATAPRSSGTAPALVTSVGLRPLEIVSLVIDTLGDVARDGSSNITSSSARLDDRAAGRARRSRGRAPCRRSPRGRPL